MRYSLFEFEWEGEGWGGGGRLFKAGRLLTFSAFRIGAYSRLGTYSNKYDNSKCEDCECYSLIFIFKSR